MKYVTRIPVFVSFVDDVLEKIDAFRFFYVVNIYFLCKIKVKQYESC